MIDGAVVYVPAIDAALQCAVGLGGTTDDRFRRWTFRGHSIQDAIDPEGNVYQLKEPILSLKRSAEQ